MVIETERRNGFLILAPQGRLDANTAAGFQERLLAELTPLEVRLILDFQAVSYLSSAGLRALMLGAKLAKKQQGLIRLTRLRPHVREVFALAGFDLILPLFPDLDQALSD